MSKASRPEDASTATRFPKGQSGNPKGRPRKVKALPSSPFAILDEKLTIESPDATSELGLETAMLIKTYQRAITGSRRAQKKLVKMVLQREAIRLKGRKPSVPGATLKIQNAEPENAFEALELLGIASRATSAGGSFPTPGPLALERWAVDAALKRLKQDDLSDSDARLIASSTHGGNTIQWRKGLRRHD